MLVFEKNPNVAYRRDYSRIVEEINDAEHSNDRATFLRIVRENCVDDLFFLMYFVLRISGVNHPWVYERVQDVSEVNAGTLDLWAREHYKSTIITYALNVQHVLRNQNVRICILSHTRDLAKAFLRRIKQTFEQNNVLKIAFSDVLWERPEVEAPKWSEDQGIIVKRDTIFQEATVEAYGLVDSMPTGKHFDVLNFDDVVTKESVTTPAQIAKVDEAFALADNLGVQDTGIQRVVGTHYHFHDLYAKQRKLGTWNVRIHPALGEDGEPVLLSPEELALKRKRQGTYVFSCQQLLNPVPDEQQTFKAHWINYYGKLPSGIVKVLLCDPASGKKEKKEKHDYTVMWVWAIDERGNYYWVDAIREKLDLHDRWRMLRYLWKRHPQIRRVGYEEYGLQADIQFFKYKMAEEGVYFHIIPLGGRLAKEDRIRRLQPLFENGQVYFPREPIMYEGVDMVRTFIEDEYEAFPYCMHDDMLDAASRLLDVDMHAVVLPSSDSSVQEVDEEDSTNVIDLWSRRKGKSRFAFC